MSTLDPNAIYEKTLLGRNAVALRRGELAPRMRTLLILVDGRKSGQALMDAMLGITMPLDGFNALQVLLDGGYIVKQAPSSHGLAGKPSTAPTTPFTVAPDEVYLAKLENTKRYVLGYMTRYLGRDTHIVLGALVDAKSHSQFVRELQLCHQIIVDVASATEAQALITNCKQMLKA